MSVVADVTLEALREHGTERLEKYAASLQAACSNYPPPYGMAWYGDKYRAAASDPNWLAMSLVANAAKEGEGAQKLWGLVSRTADQNVAHQIRMHAVDESRHARLYIVMLETAFPCAVSQELHQDLLNLSPGYSIRDWPSPSRSAPVSHVLDELIQMNIGEIRTRIHQLLLRPVITAYCPPDRQPKLKRTLDSLLEDETRHIEYTARLIEEGFSQGYGDFVCHTMAKRLDEFNQITLREVGELTFD